MSAKDALLLPRPLRVLLLLLSQLLSLSLLLRAGVEGGVWIVVVGAVVGHASVDGVTLVTHWVLDNYFAPTTPVIGKVVFFFRQHHKTPLSMFERDFVDNNFEQALWCLCWSLPAVVVHASPFFAALIGWGTFVGSWITTLHKAAHVDDPGVFFGALQRLRLIVDRRHHEVHHHGDARNYGLAAGWIDVVVEGVGLLPRLEGAIERLTGVPPAHRRWRETELASSSSSEASSSDWEPAE